MVDVYILQIKVQSLINRLPDLSQGDTAGRAGAEKGCTAPRGSLQLGQELHLCIIISELHILHSFILVCYCLKVHLHAGFGIHLPGDQKEVSFMGKSYSAKSMISLV